MDSVCERPGLGESFRKPLSAALKCSVKTVARLKDIGSNGARIASDRFLEEGLFLKLGFFIQKGCYVCVFGKIVRCEKTDFQLYESSFEFWHLDEVSRKLVDDFLYQ